MQEEFKSIEGKINSLEDLIDKNKTEIENKSNADNPFKQNLDRIIEEEKTKVSEVEDLEEELEILDHVKYLCSPEGVKSHIISKIVSLFNAKLNHYLDILSSPCHIEFDEFFEAKITNTKGSEVSYHSLSGGERKRVDISLLFAFRDIRKMQSNISINVAMLDELFDSALCSNGISKSIEILNNSISDSDESISIITHRLSQIDHDDHNIIYLEKENGITRMVEPDEILV